MKRECKSMSTSTSTSVLIVGPHSKSGDNRTSERNSTEDDLMPASNEGASSLMITAPTILLLGTSTRSYCKVLGDHGSVICDCTAAPYELSEGAAVTFAEG